MERCEAVCSDGNNFMFVSRLNCDGCSSVKVSPSLKFPNRILAHLGSHSVLRGNKANYFSIVRVSVAGVVAARGDGGIGASMLSAAMKRLCWERLVGSFTARCSAYRVINKVSFRRAGVSDSPAASGFHTPAAV